MKFLELRDRLSAVAGDPDRQRANPEAVWWDRYDAARMVDEQGRRRDPEFRWHLREVDDGIVVAWLERGQFAFEHRFEDEDSACDWLYAHLSAPTPPPVTMTEAEIVAATERMQRRIAAERAERASKERQAKGGSDGP